MSQKSKVYEGKAKVLYSIENSENLLMEYKDSLTAFNAQKKGSFLGKGEINCRLTVLIYRFLEAKGVRTHLVESRDDHSLLVKKIKIIPLEVVVRNIMAGSTAKKLGLAEGTELKHALVEFYYKDDALGDPFVSDDQILAMGWASGQVIEELKKQALLVNQNLQVLMNHAGFDLVDFKIEFGFDSSGQIILADEISPDCCRLWDKKTKEKFDKDRFRRDLGFVEEAYREVLQRVQKALEKGI